MLGCPAQTPSDAGERVLEYGMPEEAGFSPEGLEAAVDLVRRAVAEGRVTGVQVLVARHAKVVVHEALGMRDLERQVPMKHNTLLRLASVTKTVVATGVLMLVEQGRLNIADPVSKHLPGFSEGWSAQVTIRDLLRHASGFPFTFENFVGDVTEQSLEYPDAPSLRVEAVKIGHAGPEVAPGTRCQYSNWGYTVLGAVLESAAGRKLDDFLYEQLYAPLGMTETSHALYGVDSARVSLNYQWAGDRWEIFPPEAPPFARSTGGLVTTAWDFAHFLQMWLDGGRYGGQRFLQPGTAAEATNLQAECPYLYAGRELLDELDLQPMWYYERDRRARGLDLGYGYGWAVGQAGVFSHGGVRGTFVLVDPASDLIVLLLAQSRLGGTPGQAFIEAVFDAMVE